MRIGRLQARADFSGSVVARALARAAGNLWVQHSKGASRLAAFAPRARLEHLPARVDDLKEPMIMLPERTNQLEKSHFESGKFAGEQKVLAILAYWLIAELEPKPGFERTPEELGNLKQIAIMLLERMDRWEKGAFERGRLEGIREGEQRILLRQMNRRFGTLSPDLQQRIQRASTAQLDAWVDQILDAQTLDELFGENGLAH